MRLTDTGVLVPLVAGRAFLAVLGEALETSVGVEARLLLHATVIQALGTLVHVWGTVQVRRTHGIRYSGQLVAGMKFHVYSWVQDAIKKN